LRLDRFAARSQGGEHIRELVQSPVRKLEILIGYGSPGNHVDFFGKQLRDHVASQERIRICRDELRFPEARGETLTSDTFMRSLQRDLESMKIGPALQHRTPIPSRRSAAVLMLDFGRIGEEEELDTRDVGAWMVFCAEKLLPLVPEQCCFLAYVGIETEASQETARPYIEDLFPKGKEGALHCVLLPAIGLVPKSELQDFMREPDFCSCPDDLVDDIAAQLHQETGGNYERILKRLERAERRSWSELYERIKDQPSPSPSQLKAGFKL